MLRRNTYLALSTGIRFNSTLDPVDFQTVPNGIFRSLEMLYCELPHERPRQPHTKQRTNNLIGFRLCLERVWNAFGAYLGRYWKSDKF
jgi:hypothetical protein